jgi:hypothetical protein
MYSRLGSRRRSEKAIPSIIMNDYIEVLCRSSTNYV